MHALPGSASEQACCQLQGALMHVLPGKQLNGGACASCFLCVLAVSTLFMLDLAFNFFRYLVSKSWHDQCLWGGAAQVRGSTDLCQQGRLQGVTAGAASSSN
jgi:hypothetical protein